MATRTTNYDLYLPDSTDSFEDFRAEHNANMEIIDRNLGGGGGGGHTIVDENGSDMASEPKLQFTGNVNVTDDSVNGKTIVDIPSSSGSGHTIIDPNGSSMTQRGGLKFTGNVSVTDDSGNNETIIDILGGGGGGLECYLDNGLVADNVGAYITCPLDKPMENGLYLYLVVDNGVIGLQSYGFFKWTGTTYVSSIGNPKITITATTAGLTYYSGAWREIRAYIFRLI